MNFHQLQKLADATTNWPEKFNPLNPYTYYDHNDAQTKLLYLLKTFDDMHGWRYDNPEEYLMCLNGAAYSSWQYICDAELNGKEFALEKAVSKWLYRLSHDYLIDMSWVSESEGAQ